jgi:LysM repeat protein
MSANYFHTTYVNVADSSQIDIWGIQARLTALGYTSAVSRYAPEQLRVSVTEIPDGYIAAPDFLKDASIDNDITLAVLTYGRTPTTETTTTTTTGGGSSWFDVPYTVKAGDTLSKIGALLGVSWQAIAQANNIKSPYTIRIGQKLTIPKGNGTVILQPQNLPPVLTSNNNTSNTPTNNPLPLPTLTTAKNWFDAFYENKKLTGAGIAALILIGGVVIMSRK